MCNPVKKKQKQNVLPYDRNIESGRKGLLLNVLGRKLRAGIKTLKIPFMYHLVLIWKAIYAIK